MAEMAEQAGKDPQGFVMIFDQENAQRR